MFIKQIIVQGFKSYKDQVVIEPFSQHCNVVIGRNGSGKSNFFAAIRFVLSDAYNHISREERQTLLHEGTGNAVMSAYVEIIFDNTDNRFPTGKDELILRRTIGLKKDEYSLDRKSASKSDVMNLLESAGFSRSNPYYIVPQGRVTALTNAKDKERLALLKEVAGTQVYENRRKESLKIMEETSSKRTKIDDLLKYIDDRLSELEEEKKELRGYQDKDKERRCLEYTVYERELSEISTALEDIEESRTDRLNNAEEQQSIFLDRESQLEALRDQIAELKQRASVLSAERFHLSDDHKHTLREKANAELRLTSIEEEETQQSGTRERNIHEVQEIEDAIRRNEANLNEVIPQYHALKDVEDRAKKELEDASEIRQRLYEKQGRGARFRNKRDRDQFLRKEIADIDGTIKTRQASVEELKEQVERLQTSLSTLESQIASSRSMLEHSRHTIDDLIQRATIQKTERERLSDERMSLWREEVRLDAAVRHARDEHDKATKAIGMTMDRSLNSGLQTIRRLQQSGQIAGIHGVLCDLFEVDDRYRTAVEVTAGASLFHVIVDNDETASKILDVLNRQKAGRVTFMPLNRLHPKPASFPDSSDAIPMIKKISFDPAYTKAFEQVFGRTIICPNLEVASQYARTNGLSAITLAGDQSDKRGALTGGYHDSRRSRLDAVKNQKKWSGILSTESAKLKSVRDTIERLEQEISQKLGMYNRTEMEKQNLDISIVQLARQLQAQQREQLTIQDSLETKQGDLAGTNSNLHLLQEQQSSYSQELSSAFTKRLNADEEAQLQEIGGRIQQLRERFSAAAADRAVPESEKLEIESTLRLDLYQRRDAMNARLANRQATNQRSTDSDDTALSNARENLARLTQHVLDTVSRIDLVDEELHEVNRNISHNQSELTKVESQQIEHARVIDKEQKNLERSLAKRALLMHQKDECNRNIRDLGVLPEEAYTHFKGLDSNTIVKRLHKTQEAIKKFSHVNKKAFEQYNNFTKQRDTLLQRREELDASQGSIEELIEVLDQRKDEAIERTFKQVSKGFAEVFEKLVPAGKGRLIIQRRVDTNHEDQEDSNEEDDRHVDSIENYIGVAISVSFTSKVDEQQRIQQLSGGQKSLCALALIFAIQGCDPAPFYLFDEIDANLDAQYRTAVAKMLAELSQSGQFICTTFRPELIQTGDKFYGVLFNHKVSTIAAITKDSAISFVQQQETL